jgi:hypothetical protein
MKSDHDSKFVRRHNGDGTVDSICLICFQTAATAKSESQLTALEDQHQCHGYTVTARADTLQFPNRSEEST